jgi:hypothetical protein
MSQNSSQTFNDEKKVQVKIKMKDSSGETKSTFTSFIQNSNKEEENATQNNNQTDSQDEDLTDSLPLNLGVTTLTNLGIINFQDRAFHTDRYIYPIGFKSQRSYQSYKNMDEKCLYFCEISEDEEKKIPLFKVQAEGIFFF